MVFKKGEGYWKDKKMSKNHKKNLSISHQGQTPSELCRKRASEVNKNKIISETHRKKLSIRMKGDENPMKNPNSKKKSSESHLGQKSWNTGMKIDESKYPNYGMTGKHHTKESMEKRFNTMKERDSFTRMFGDENPSTRPESIANFKERRKNWVTPIKDTSIELKIQNYLKQLNIGFFAHYYCKEIGENAYQCDIFIPIQKNKDRFIREPVIIECDGEVFHYNPKKYKPGDKIFKNNLCASERWNLDKKRTEALVDKGFKVLRLWENEIKKMSCEELNSKVVCQYEK